LKGGYIPFLDLNEGKRRTSAPTSKVIPSQSKDDFAFEMIRGWVAHSLLWDPLITALRFAIQIPMAMKAEAEAKMSAWGSFFQHAPKTMSGV